MSEATATDSPGSPQRIVKGAFAVVIGLAQPSPSATAAANELEGKGFRVLAVAAGPPNAMKLAGLIALSDPPRADSAALIAELHGLGVRTVMVTGDAPATAAIVAKAVGLDGAICPPGPIPDSVRPEQFAVFAGVLPEDKYKLVKAFQTGGHIVGMCGDGANDAPALRQAQMGIAVSTATDVAKSAAGMVLTEPGLAGIVAAVKEGRVTFQRILTYTLNSIIKKIVTVLFLIAGLIMTGQAILTPLLMVIVMVAGDFLAMSLTTDNVQPSPMPNTWRIGSLTMAGVVMGICLLAFCSGVLAVGKFEMGLGIEALRTLAFIGLGVREPGDHLCHSSTPAPVGLSSEPLARRVVSGGYRDRLNIGHSRNCHDASAGLGNCRHACCGGWLRIVLGHGEGSGIRSTRHRLGAGLNPRRQNAMRVASIAGRMKMKINSKDFRVKEGDEVNLKKWPTSIDPLYKSKEHYQELLGDHVARLSSQQQLLYASNRHAILLIFQAMDAAGKDGAIKHVMSGVNPQGCQVFSFKHPSPAELQHDFLWRTTRDLPERGRIGIFNRSYYEEVLIVRVHPELLDNEGLPDAPHGGKTVWHDRYRSIVDLEKHLHNNGTRIVKFFLHLSEEEQRKRFLARIDEPDKNWKFSLADIKERKFWKQYMKAYEECLSATSTSDAPWYAVPADDKENARLIVSQIVLDTFEELKMAYPKMSADRQRELQSIREKLSG